MHSRTWAPYSHVKKATVALKSFLLCCIGKRGVEPLEINGNDCRGKQLQLLICMFTGPVFSKALLYLPAPENEILYGPFYCQPDTLTKSTAGHIHTGGVSVASNPDNTTLVTSLKVSRSLFPSTHDIRGTGLPSLLSIIMKLHSQFCNYIAYSPSI